MTTVMNQLDNESMSLQFFDPFDLAPSDETGIFNLLQDGKYVLFVFQILG